MCAFDSIKYPVHFLKGECSLPEGFPYISDFKARLLQPPSALQDDFNTIVDAVWGESPAVEKVSTKAPAALGRSNKPGIGSPEAPPHQTDHGTCTRQPARSSKNSEAVRGVFKTFIYS